MYLLNSLLLSSKQLPLTLDELASKIENKQLTTMFMYYNTETQLLLNDSRNVDPHVKNLHRAIDMNVIEYFYTSKRGAAKI